MPGLAQHCLAGPPMAGSTEAGLTIAQLQHYFNGHIGMSCAAADEIMLTHCGYPSQLRPTLASQAHLWAERSTMGSPFC